MAATGMSHEASEVLSREKFMVKRSLQRAATGLPGERRT